MTDPENGTIVTNATESSEEDTAANSNDDRKEIVEKLMKDPQMLAALQTRLKRYLGSPSGYIESLPKSVKRRIKALKNLQLKFTDIEADFFREVHALEEKYDKVNAVLYQKRNCILNGVYEPTDEEAEFTVYSEDEEVKEEETLSKCLEEKAKVDENEERAHNFDENTKGIPEFWLTIFKNVDLLTEMVQDHDEPILVNLQDIQLKLSDNPMGFTLEFHFAENDYFTNKVLTKYYEMKCEPDKEDPFSFEGPEIVKCNGCKIDWKKGKNITQKILKKKQKHKSRGAVRTITKTVQNDSFFNFFNPPPVPEESSSDDMDEDTQALLTADFEIGHYIRERIIPRAVLYFTGEALDDKDYEEEEEEEEEYDSEDDSDYEPDKGAVVQKEPNCKQQ